MKRKLTALIIAASLMLCGCSDSSKSSEESEDEDEVTKKVTSEDIPEDEENDPDAPVVIDISDDEDKTETDTPIAAEAVTEYDLSDTSSVPQEQPTNYDDMWSVLPYIDETPLSELNYYYEEHSGNMKITGYTGFSDAVRIPEIIDGKPVTSINLPDGSGYGGEDGIHLKELIVPDTVKTITTDLSSLEYLNIPSGAIAIEHRFPIGHSFSFPNIKGLYLCTNQFDSSLLKDSSSFKVMHNGKLYDKSNISDIDKELLPYIKNDGTVYDFFERDNKPYSIIIPSACKSISGNAFAGCENLIGVTFKEGVEYIGYGAFADCTALDNVSFPDSLTNIDYEAFRNTALKEVFVPDSVELLGGEGEVAGEGAFSYCRSLKKARLGKGIFSMEAVFSGCTALTEVELPEGLKTLGRRIFSGCTNLKSISIPSSITSFGSYAFANWTGLESFTIPDFITGDLQETFVDCTSLKSVVIGNGIERIGFESFRGCTALKEVTLGTGVTDISESAFSDCHIAVLTDNNGTLPLLSARFIDTEKLIIGDNITELAPGQYRSFPNLKEVVFGKNLVSIGDINRISETPGMAYDGCFEWCTSLKEVVLPSSLKKLGEYTFCFCSSLERVVLNDGLEQIGVGAFGDCTNLKNISVPMSVKVLGQKYYLNGGNTYGYAGAFDSSTDITVSYGIEQYNSSNIEELYKTVDDNYTKSYSMYDDPEYQQMMREYYESQNNR